MDYRLVEKDAFEIVGKGIQVSTVNGENQRAIPAFWDESNRNGFSDELAKNCGPLGLLGVCMQFDPVNQEFTYFIAAEKTGDDVPSDWEVREIPAASWAVFESVGPMPHAIQNVWERIYSEWFPQSGYEHADAPEMEVYLEGDIDSENYRCEVWIPVMNK